MQQVKYPYLLPFSLLLAGLLSCSALSQASFKLGLEKITPIHDLKPQNHNAIVYLQGKVVKQVPLLGQRVYQLQDTSTIWVLTNQTTPQPGDQVLLKAQVLYQSIPLAGKEFGEVYVEQQEQLERTPAR